MGFSFLRSWVYVCHGQGQAFPEPVGDGGRDSAFDQRVPGFVTEGRGVEGWLSSDGRPSRAGQDVAAFSGCVAEGV